MNLLAMQGMNDFTTVLFVVLIGILVIFLGMIVIILILSLIGTIFDKINNKKEKPKAVVETNKEEVVESSDLDGKTKAAIMAAIYMYYLNEGSNCEFVVKKIKKI